MASDNFSFSNDISSEIALLEALGKYKPVGIGRHFTMTFILDELREKCEAPIKAKHVWDHLNTLYDIEELTRLNKENDENLDKLTDFELPMEKYSQYMKKDTSTPSPNTEPEVHSDKEEESAPETVANTSKNVKSKRKEETSKSRNESRKRSRTSENTSSSKRKK